MKERREAPSIIIYYLRLINSIISMKVQLVESSYVKILIITQSNWKGLNQETKDSWFNCPFDWKVCL